MKSKRMIVFTAGFLAMMSFGTVSASAQDIVESDMKIVLNGSELAYNQSYLIDNSLFVPYRSFAESIGAEVSWDDATRSVMVMKGSQMVTLTIGSTSATVDGEETTLAAAPQIINDSTFVPVRFLSETFGIKVDYNDATRTVSLSSDAVQHAYTIEISEFQFHPGELTIEAGSTVTFTNKDSVQHNAVAVDGSFETPLLGEGESATVTFAHAGEYDFYCAPHKSMMTGKIIVK